MQAIDDLSFFETRPVFNIRTGRTERVTLRRSHWRAVQDWADSFNMTYKAALSDLQSDIAASWADIHGYNLSLADRLLCVLLYGESCTAFYGAANENDLWGAELIAEIGSYNPRIPPFTLTMPVIKPQSERMPRAKRFLIPRAD